VEITGTSGEKAFILPFFVPGPFKEEGVSALLQALCRKQMPNAEWGEPQRVGLQALRITGRSEGMSVAAAMVWVMAPQGSAGTFYLTSAPQARYPQATEAFVRLLKSLRIQGSPTAVGGPPGGSLPEFVSWEDPHEKAFSLQVPRGWQVSGGLFRYAAVDIRPEVVAVSPDEKILIRLGDREIPPFTEPNATLALAGFTEGSLYSPGYGVVMRVKQYMPGVEFAEEYVRTRVGEISSDLQFVEKKDRPDVADIFNRIYQKYEMFNIQTTLTTGEVVFTCRRENTLMRGYCFAGTLRTIIAPDLGNWLVQHLAGFLAEAGQESLAQAVGERMLKTFQINPQWMAMQQNITASTGQVVHETHEAISKLSSQSYWYRQAVNDEMARRRSNAILEVVDVVDPVTGEGYKVESGSNYYWIDPQGHIVGTETYAVPAIDFRELLQLP